MRSWPLRPPLRHSMPAASLLAWPEPSAPFVAPKWPNVAAPARPTTAPTNRRGTGGLIWASGPAVLKSQRKIDFASSRPYLRKTAEGILIWSGLPICPGPFFVGAVKLHQQLYSTDDSTLLRGSPTI